MIDVSVHVTIDPASRYQFRQYYIHGKFNDCKMERAILTSCFKWKAKKSQETKVEAFPSPKLTIWYYRIPFLTNFYIL